MKTRENFSEHLPSYFEEQYQLVQASRKILLDYCATISKEDFTKKNNAFGIASVRDLLVHIANSYQAWLGRALKQKSDFTSKEKITSMEEVRQVYKEVDDLMQQFIVLIAKEKPKMLQFDRNGERMEIPPLQLFSHITTHEFHHKGQILSLSRHLGYLPVDTDIIQ